MIRSLGTTIDRTDVLVASLGGQHSFVIIQGGNLEKPLVVPYPVLLKAIVASINIPAGSAAWGSILPGTGIASQTDLITYLNNNYYPLSSNPAGYVTSSSLATTLLGYVTTAALASALAGYVPTSRTITINGTTFDLSANRSWTISAGSGTVTSVSATVPSPPIPAFSVSVGTPTTTPAIAITANGTASQVVTGNGSLASIASISTVSSIFQEDVYITNTAPIGTEYVPSVGKLYVCNLTSGNVTIFDTTNGNLLATVSVTNALRAKYIQSRNEIWVSSSTLTTITRISPTTNLVLGTITGVTTGGGDFFEYSSTKVFLTIGAGSGSIVVIDPSTLSVAANITTSVPPFPATMAYNSKSSSLQFDKIVITAQNGIFILDPNTNSVSTTVVNPSSAFSSGIRILYSATDDKYYATSLSNNRIVVLSIATATTFTATFLGNSLFINDIRIDEANDLLFAFPVEGGAGQNVLVKIYKKSTMAPIIAFRTSCYGGTSQAGNAAIDLLNKRIFLTGRNTAANSSVSVIRYL